MPVAAFADGSAEQGGYVSNYFFTEEGAVWIEGDVTIESVSDAGPAANTVAGAEVLCSYEIVGTVNSGEATVGLPWSDDIDSEYVTVFIQHEGWNEQRVVDHPTGNIAYVNVSEFSTFTVVEGAYYGTAPKTGADNTGIAVATVTAIVCACGVAFALRKKVVA